MKYTYTKQPPATQPYEPYGSTHAEALAWYAFAIVCAVVAVVYAVKAWNDR